MYENGLSPADLRAVIGGGNCNSGSFLGGGNFFEAIIALAVLAMFTGNGNGIFGSGGNRGEDVRAAVDQQTLIGKLDGITNGISDSTYALTGAITGGFHAAEVAACQQQAAIMAQLCAMAADNAKCCCDIRGDISDVRYSIANTGNALQNAMCLNTRDIIDNSNNNFRALDAKLTAMEMGRKDEKIAEQNQTIWKYQIAESNAAQTGQFRAAIDAAVAEILRRTGAECPTPAYIVNAPTPVSFPVNSCGQVVFGGGGYAA